MESVSMPFEKIKNDEVDLKKKLLYVREGLETTTNMVWFCFNLNILSSVMVFMLLEPNVTVLEKASVWLLIIMENFSSLSQYCQMFKLTRTWYNPFRGTMKLSVLQS